MKLRPNASPIPQAILARAYTPKCPAPTITLGPVDFFGRAENAILILRALCNPPLDALPQRPVRADVRHAVCPSIPACSPRTSPSRHAQTTAAKRWPPVLCIPAICAEIGAPLSERAG
ncbi:MAG: hypothetical protein ACLUN5_08160 [Oscillospiraceae bacterium]